MIEDCSANRNQVIRKIKVRIVKDCVVFAGAQATHRCFCVPTEDPKILRCPHGNILAPILNPDYIHCRDSNAVGVGVVRGGCKLIVDFKVQAQIEFFRNVASKVARFSFKAFHSGIARRA